MRTLLNVIWLVLSGFWMFLGYLAAGILLCVLILTIPWGIASFRIGLFALWPFGRTVVSKPTAGIGSFLGNVVWVILAGWWLALGNIVTGIAMCLTIIGIPLGLASYKRGPSGEMTAQPFSVDMQPCMRYVLAADHSHPEPNRSWQPRVLGTEPIPKCMKKYADQLPPAAAPVASAGP